MLTAKVFANGGSQAVRLPKEYQFDGDEVYVNKIGSMVILFPKEKAWELFEEGIEMSTEDFMAEGRSQEGPVRTMDSL